MSELWQAAATEERLTKELEKARAETAAAVAKANKAEAAESVAKAKLAALQKGNESLMTQALEQLKQQLTEDFDAKKKHELKSFEAKEQELQNEVRTKQKTVDDLLEEIEQAKRDDPKGEPVRKLEKKLKEKERELDRANAVLDHVKEELKEASCSHTLSFCAFHLTHHTPPLTLTNTTTCLPSPILLVLPGKGQGGRGPQAVRC